MLDRRAHAVGERRAREGADEGRILSGAFWAGVMFNVATVVGIFVISQGIYSGTDDSTTRIAVVILLSSYLSSRGRA